MRSVANRCITQPTTMPPPIEQLKGLSAKDWKHLLAGSPEVAAALRAVLSNRVVLTIEGGALRHAMSDHPIDVLLVDYDIQGLDEDQITQVPQSDRDGDTEGARLTLHGGTGTAPDIDEAFALYAKSQKMPAMPPNV